MKEVLYINTKPNAYIGSNYYQRRTDFLKEIQAFIDHAKLMKKHICLSDFLRFFELKYGFSTKVIKAELNRLEKKLIIVIYESDDLINVFSDLDDTTPTFKSEAEAEAERVLKEL